MKILIDVQCLQGENSHRGIGKYTRDFLTHYVSDFRHDSVLFLINDSDVLAGRETIKFLETLVDKENIRMVSLFGDRESQDYRHINKAIISEAVWSVAPDVFLVASYFEGMNSQTFTYLPEGPQTNAVILYDLIPLIFKEKYLANLTSEKWYREKCHEIKNANKLLCISRRTAEDAQQLLNIESSKIEFIGAAVDKHRFKQARVKGSSTNLPYMVYTGGIDWRKNVEGLIKSFSCSKAKLAGLQLKIVCEIREAEKGRLRETANALGLNESQLEFTGLLSDQELDNLVLDAQFCIFPSLYEGFGLPVLEALSMGKAVACSDTSSLIEIQDNKLALFNPESTQNIADTIDLLHFDQSVRQNLETLALVKAREFSWESVVQRARKGLKASAKSQGLDHIPSYTKKLALAFVSPMPPAKSGIAYYSSTLLHELNRHYQITVIDTSDNGRSSRALEVEYESVEWFRKNSKKFDRIIYQLGNSELHLPVLDLISSIPGITVFHDYYLGGLIQLSQIRNPESKSWDLAVLESGGYPSLVNRESHLDVSKFVGTTTANQKPLRESMGNIFHNSRALELYKLEYPKTKPEELLAVLPMISTQNIDNNTSDNNSEFIKLREKYEIDKNAFVICTFGFVTKFKGLREIAIAISNVSKSTSEQIIFVNVGENDPGEYGVQLLEEIKALGISEIFRISGWSSEQSYKDFLQIADCVIQLRTPAKGETSAAILDAIAAGKAVIANTSLVPDGYTAMEVLQIPDEIDSHDISSAISRLLLNPLAIRDYGLAAKAKYNDQNTPRVLADLYQKVIEQMYVSSSVKKIERLRDYAASVSTKNLPLLVEKINWFFEPLPRKAHLYVDVTLINQQDFGTGIQRVVRSILKELLTGSNSNLIVSPVYYDKKLKSFRHAGQYVSRILDLKIAQLNNFPIEPWKGDSFLGLDYNPFDLESKFTFFEQMRLRGVNISFVLYDLLPLEMENFFQKGARQDFVGWLRFISNFSSVHCISESVSVAYKNWLRTEGVHRQPRISTFPLGFDFPETTEVARQKQTEKRNNLSFLMVGTIEPRKGYDYVLDEFEILWDLGLQATLTVVGKEGWLMPNFRSRVEKHRLFQTQLFWHERLSDMDLAEKYSSNFALIASSYGEGYGLPILEASFFGMQIIARDIPVFREVSPRGTVFFSDMEGESLSKVIAKMAVNSELNTLVFNGEKTEIPTWAESAERLKQAIVLDENRGKFHE